MLERCVLLHDIGKVAIPDHILLKPGKLDAEERSIMESHTLLGANILEAVARQQGACLAFLQMAIDIVRHHHEQYDGNGYPHGLVGDAIPLAARFTTVGTGVPPVQTLRTGGTPVQTLRTGGTPVPPIRVLKPLLPPEGRQLIARRANA